MVETNSADKAQLAGPVAEMSGRHVIAEAIPRPSQLPRFWRDVEFCFDDPLIVVVAWPQHHPVLTECDRLFIMISRNVSDAENRHCHPKIMNAPATSNAAAILSTTCMSWARWVSNSSRAVHDSLCGQHCKRLSSGPLAASLRQVINVTDFRRNEFVPVGVRRSALRTFFHARQRCSRRIQANWRARPSEIAKE